MKRLASIVVVGLFSLCAIQTGLVAEGSPRLADRYSPSAADGSPNIVYAEWTGKTLVVEGESFADGAAVLIDGQEFKTSISPASPGFLYAKKAKKKIAPDQVIQLQVQNPDGKLSNEFTFFSGFVVTFGFQRSWINLRPGERFLLYLPPGGEPPATGWTITVIGPDPTVLTQTMDNLPIPHAQGFFQAVRPGLVSIEAQGDPLCPPLPAWRCEQSGSYMGFSVGVVVQ
jgi:hypothetical protein